MTAPFLAPERDVAFRYGRLKYATDTYIIPGVRMTGTGTKGLAGGTDYYFPIVVQSAMVVDQMAAEITTAAGTNFRIGLYLADRSWQPVGAPRADSGNLDATGTGVKTYTPGTPLYLPRGIYLGVVNSDGAPSIRTWLANLQTTLPSTLGTNLINELRVTRAYAAFPTPGTAWDTVSSTTSTFGNGIVYRVSAA